MHVSMPQQKSQAAKFTLLIVTLAQERLSNSQSWLRSCAICAMHVVRLARKKVARGASEKGTSSKYLWTDLRSVAGILRTLCYDRPFKPKPSSSIVTASCRIPLVAYGTGILQLQRCIEEMILGRGKANALRQSSLGRQTFDRPECNPQQRSFKPAIKQSSDSEARASAHHARLVSCSAATTSAPEVCP